MQTWLQALVVKHFGKEEDLPDAWKSFLKDLEAGAAASSAAAAETRAAEPAAAQAWAGLDRERLLEAAATGISHQLNNLLVPILGEAQFLGSRLHEEELLRSVASMEGAAIRIAQLVRRLQGFGEASPSPAEFIDLNEIARSAVEVTRGLWKERAEAEGRFITVNLQLREVPLVRTRPKELREALCALVVNAAEAIRGSGTVCVRTAMRDGSVVLSVEDDGGGISAEAQSQVFQPFYSTKGPSHAGLGLSLASSVAARSGGSVRLLSEPERGTSIELLFPHAERAQPRTPAPASSQGPGPRILVVDDEDVVRRVLGRCLSETGFRVTLANDGEMALAMLRLGDFDLVLTDWVMPGMDGLALARAIKNTRPGLPVVLCTGRATQPLETAREEGWIDCILSKPVDMVSMQRALSELTRRP